MANLTTEQEQINSIHINHQVRQHVDYDPNCRECIRRKYWQPPTRECNWCTNRLADNKDSNIAHLEYHMSHPESITK